MRKLSTLIGLILAVLGFVAVVVVGQLTQPPTYDVVVVVQEIPAFTDLKTDQLAVDTQSLSPAIAAKYVSADELTNLLAGGAVAVEHLRPGQPLLREQVASGDNAAKVSRLSVALTDPDLVIIAVPVQVNTLPTVLPGDVVGLFFASGNVQAQQIVTATVSGPTPTPVPDLPGVISETVIITTELQLPVAKWLANGVVYRLNREVKENPNYGAPGQDSANEPRYIEGDVKSLDVVVRREAAEWVAFALAHGEVQIGVLPAVTRPEIETGGFKASHGVTWSDFEDLFFADRGQ